MILPAPEKQFISSVWLWDLLLRPQQDTVTNYVSDVDAGKQIQRCVCTYLYVSMFVCVLCCGRGLWAPGSHMKDISHVAGLVELLSQRAATNQCFLPLCWPDSVPLTLWPATMLAHTCKS